MELVQIDTSRIILLTDVHRPAGSTYLPEVVAKTVQRYGFVQYPTAEQLLKDDITFKMGKFGDSSIGEMKVYNDGVIVSARANTAHLEAFLSDIFSWLKEEFGIVRVSTVEPETHYESLIVVRAEADLLSILRPQKAALSAISDVWEKGYYSGQFAPSAAHFAVDPTELKLRRKPNYFGIERRHGHPFGDNIFHAGAPLKTEDHLAVLTRLEDLARG